MKNEYLKTLWMLRFEKIKKNEQSAAWKYEKIKDVCSRDFGSNHEVVSLLNQLVNEELQHAKLAEELILICSNTHPECQALKK